MNELLFFVEQSKCPLKYNKTERGLSSKKSPIRVLNDSKRFESSDGFVQISDADNKRSFSVLLFVVVGAVNAGPDINGDRTTTLKLSIESNSNNFHISL